MTQQPYYPPQSPVSNGIRGLCPRCGQGKLFKGYLTVPDKCDHCGLDFSFSDSGDGAALVHHAGVRHACHGRCAVCRAELATRVVGACTGGLAACGWPAAAVVATGQGHFPQPAISHQCRAKAGWKTSDTCNVTWRARRTWPIVAAAVAGVCAARRAGVVAGAAPAVEAGAD